MVGNWKFLPLSSEDCLIFIKLRYTLSSFFNSSNCIQDQNSSSSKLFIQSQSIRFHYRTSTSNLSCRFFLRRNPLEIDYNTTLHSKDSINPLDAWNYQKSKSLTRGVHNKLKVRSSFDIIYLTYRTTYSLGVCENPKIGMNRVEFPKNSSFPKKSRFPKISRTQLPFLELLYNAV